MRSEKPAPAPAEHPHRVALEMISRTRQLLGTLITSSESFDYPRAKLALKELDRMTRELRRVETRLRSENPETNEPKIVPFPPGIST